MIELKNVVKTYQSNNGDKTKAIDDISFKLANKGLTFIVGTSGSGKSTLLNVLGGLDTINSGSILIDGKELNKFSKSELDNYRNNYVGFIFQDYNVIEDYNLKDNISLSLDLQSISNNDLVLDTIDKVGLKGLDSRNMNELSGGQKQRVAIARALVKNPHLLLADEPTGNLDSKTSKQIIEILKNISKEHLVVVVSHDMELASTYADRIIEIEDGKIVNDSKEVTEENINDINLTDSKLPLKRIIKLANANMIHKFGRLTMTILLTGIATFFLAFCLNIYFFNAKDLYKTVAKDNNVINYEIGNTEQTFVYDNYGEVDSSRIEEFYITDDDFKKANSIAKDKVYYTYSINNNGKSLQFNYGENDFKHAYYSTSPNLLFVEIKENSFIGDIIGNNPKNDNEVVIDNYTAEYIVKYGVYLTDNTLYKPSDIESIINDKKELKLGNIGIYVVGIVKDVEPYKTLFESVKKTGRYNSELETFRAQTFKHHNYTYVNGLVDKINIDFEIEEQVNNIDIEDNHSYDGIKVLNGEQSYINQDGIIESTSILKDDEVIVSKQYIEWMIITKMKDELSNRVTIYLKNHPNANYEEGEKQVIIKYIKDNNVIGKKLKLNDGFWLKVKDNSYLTIKGVSLEDTSYVNSNVLKNYIPIYKECKKLLAITNDKDEINRIFETYDVLASENEKNYKGSTVNFEYQDTSSWISYFMDVTRKYVAALAIIFMLFDILMIYNFITVTIKFAQKTIGILRALGTKNKDVMKIFSVEALIVSISSWILSIIMWLVSSSILNKSIFGSEYIILNGIVIEPIVILIDIVFILLITTAITIMTINRISKINPIDVINNKI